jgi:uncharacterized protein YbjT (DUF2867 family)
VRIVVIGGAGLIGFKTVIRLRQAGHEIIAASRASGVNAVTGQGLNEAVAGAQAAPDWHAPAKSLG